ncbi:MAG: protein kinase domain-containing protein, partial [Planctomycetota bacterium]
MIGRTIAHYEITGKLGEGAMGEVYRATDSRLKRDVAIKLLSSRLAADPELVARLRREAEVLASLNHTNIGQIYGIEPSGDSLALVLELVEGQTLDERLKEGPLPLERALKVAQQIAAALETAHEAGIIHRDLKPANVKRTPDGDVKVLDFGLAKGTQLNLNHTDLTADGAVIGTPAYMSPEQVAGKPLDRRTDIWSFGCVFYEMLTGSKAFGGDSVGSLFAAIATEPPDLEQVAKAPRPVRNLIERCLRKDPRSRLRDIGDARVELEELLAGGAEPEPAATPMRKRPTVVVTALAVAGVLAAIALLRPPPVAEPSQPAITQYSIALFHPSGALHLDSPSGSAPPLAVSHDGRKVVFAAMSADGVRRIYLRTAESALLRPLPGTEAAEAPFFSPDGKEVGFLRTGGDGIHRISLSDGTVRKIAETLVVRGASWGRDDTIVFAHSDLGLRRVSASGGEVTDLTTVAADEHHHRWPQLLPDGKQVVFTALMRDGRLEPRVLSLESGEVVALGVQGSYARYLPGGFLVYTKEHQAWAVRFDLEANKKVGEPARVARPIHVSELGNPHLAISESGVL